MKQGSSFASLLFSLIFIVQPLSASTVDDLSDAAKSDDAARIAAIIDSGVSANSINSRGYTPLFVAVNHNSTNAVKVLLNYGADPNLDTKGFPAIVRASGRDSIIVELLLTHGADPNLVTKKFEYSALGLAVGNKTSTFERLSDSGGYSGSFPNTLKTVKALIKSGADVNHIDKFKSTPLRTAIRVGNYEVARLLLENGADVNQRVDDSTSIGIQRGNTILMNAIWWHELHKNMETIKLLLLSGANPNDANALDYDEWCDTNTSGKCDWQGYTALTFSVNRGYRDVVALLLEYGADLAATRTDGESAIDIAKSNNDEEMVELLIKHQSNH